MTDQFPNFARIVATSFQNLCKNADVFVADVPGDMLYATYLTAFPQGTNPVFKERTEHDCSRCKNFIRHVANVVTIVDGEVKTIWDDAAQTAPYPYNVVSQALRDRLTGAAVCDLFRVSPKEPGFGAEQTKSLTAEGVVLKWNHFYTGQIPSHLVVTLPDQVRGEYRTTVQVFERGLTELHPDAVETVLSLIDSNNLYRGAEHRAAVVSFQTAQRAYLGTPIEKRALFAWASAKGQGARFRNTVIGTLVQDLSEGIDLEKAVAAFESKVAPQNYKRTTAIITPGMVKKAMETIAELDLEPALECRFARIEDISVRDVLWVDSGVKPLTVDSGVKPLTVDSGVKPLTVAEENFVDNATNPQQGRLEMALELTKHIIQTKLDEEAARKTKAANRQERERLMEILAKKQDERLGEMSEKEIQKRIAALDV